MLTFSTLRQDDWEDGAVSTVSTRELSEQDKAPYRIS
jgi:hypothetical protein